jgi:hypothetical protein
MTVLRFIRAALAVVFMAIVSGVPQAVYAAVVDDCCAERCDSERDGRGCPPNCPSPSCVKVFPPAVLQSRAAGAVALARQEPGATRVVAPVLPLVLSGVFHPPRA